jgi:hypothetical protein
MAMAHQNYFISCTQRLLCESYALSKYGYLCLDQGSQLGRCIPLGQGWPTFKTREPKKKKKIPRSPKPKQKTISVGQKNVD